MTLTHLHRHSEYSTKDGLGHAEHHVARAVELGHHALALTDHGNMSGALHHIRACDASGLFPIVGVEAYFRANRLEHTPDNKQSYHMVLLARNLKGFRNLLKLTSESYRPESFYHTPCVDYELLERYAEGLFVSTACASGYVPKMIETGNEGEMNAHLDFLQNTFGDSTYVELMPFGFEGNDRLNIELVNVAMQRGMRVAGTQDAHYPCVEWGPTQWEFVKHFYSQRADVLYLTSEDEMRAMFAANHPNLPDFVIDEAIRNTESIVADCEPYYIDRGPKYPRIQKGADGKGPREILLEWCELGLSRIGKTFDKAYRERLEYEVGVMERLDVLDYMITVGTIVRWAKSEKIPVGAGRGSAAGCLIAYLIGITNLDPITHGLLFERFLNPDRRSMPDIDIDFAGAHRERVKDFIRETFGPDKVADIVAWQTYGPKSAMQKAASFSYDLSPAIVMNVTKDYPDVGGELSSFYETHEPTRRFADEHPVIWQHALNIEGQISSQSKHASAVVICDRPVTDYMPTMRAKDESTVTAWADRVEFPIISMFGFLKVDVLGIEALDKREMAVRLIKERHGVEVDIDNLGPEADPNNGDPDVLARFSDGMSLAGVFQFESSGMRQTLMDMKVDHFNDLVAAVALYRPGPMKNIPHYTKRKNGLEPVSYKHPLLETILAETYGVYVYQEQAMQIAKTLAGFTGGQADDLRKAIGKKIHEKMMALKDVFLDGCKANGIPDHVAQSLWAENEASADYSFNKSHADSYAYGAYQDMWLKHYYPHEFYTALFTHEKKEKFPRIVREVQSSSIPLLPPDVNTSTREFTLDGDAIRFGLAGVKGIGDNTVKEIMRARAEKGAFLSAEDMESKVVKRQCHSGHRRALHDAGAMDTLGGRAEWDDNAKAWSERELLGFELSADRSDYMRVITDRVMSMAEVADASEESTLIVGGEITEIKETTTKKRGDRMAFFEVALNAEMHSCTAFPRVFPVFEEYIKVGNWVLVQGEKDRRGSVNVQNMCLVQDLMKELEDAG
jgi:DNA polymerase-3 subunit alpha